MVCVHECKVCICVPHSVTGASVSSNSDCFLQKLCSRTKHTGVVPILFNFNWIKPIQYCFYVICTQFLFLAKTCDLDHTNPPTKNEAFCLLIALLMHLFFAFDKDPSKGGFCCLTQGLELDKKQKHWSWSQVVLTHPVYSPIETHKWNKPSILIVPSEAALKYLDVLLRMQFII